VDFCQALKVDPRNKYQRDGGPGMKAIMELLAGSGTPGEDRDQFMRASAFNFVIEGTDAHAKNCGLLLGAGGRYRLAPFYDVASWLPYFTNHCDDRLAMSIDGKYHFDRIMPRYWEAEARAAGYDPDRALAHIRDLIARIPDETRELLAIWQSEGSATEDLKKLTKLLIARCAELAETYGAEALGPDQSRLPGL